MTGTVLASVVGNRLHAIAERMADAMLRSCRSAAFQSRDFVTGIFDADGAWIAAKDFIPVLAGSLPSAYEGVLAKFAGDVGEGDVFVLNDPYHGNNHPPDVTVLKPVFHRGVLRFWTATKGHHADVGGSGEIGYNPGARDCYEDALRIPPVRLYRRGERQHDVWDLILLNLRLRDAVEGDLHCQIGAASIGERELLAMLDAFGVEPVLEAVRVQFAASARHMRAEIARWPDGTYEAVRHLDDGGEHHREPIAVRLALTVAGERAVFDFTASDPQVVGYANSTRANTVASTLVALFGVTDPAQRRDGGALAAVEIRTRPGTIAHAVEPAATTLCTITACEAIVETVWLALSRADPAITHAGWCRGYAFAAVGVDERTGRPFGATGALKGGSGAVLGFDGWDAIGPPVAMGGGREVDVELHELGAPATILEQGFATDSAGAGRWRGGLGGFSRWRIDQDGVRVVCIGSGALEQTVPYGLAGGLAAPANRSVVRHRDGRVTVPRTNSTLVLGRGDVIEIHTSGGGGYGDPRERSRAAVRADVRDGLVSEAAARDVYGLDITPVNSASTADTTDRSIP
ncbi:hydantoinase B/oxoprolinase family protein [Actinomadura terrae]|uniref:hydantoinase B/oxoprolinase family protein n=1 Tax=Actinomadura terrae TaxID=604353 RepID=UPI001FA78905|nr:hydantoinase B/oxoprolinase family protein [Actinomadura terrae]